MDKIYAIKQLLAHDAKGRYVFTNSDLSKIFHNDSKRAFRAGLQRLIKSEILIRACTGVYINNLSNNKGSNLLEQVAKTIRRGKYNYVSLESALSEYGVISQIPIDRLTVMTTGRKGEYETPFGTIEFTHTKRPLKYILDNSEIIGRPLRFAHKMTAYRDLKRVGRNIHLIDKDTLHDD